MKYDLSKIPVSTVHLCSVGNIHVITVEGYTKLAQSHPVSIDIVNFSQNDKY